ncbi:tripartite motif-containing protein 43C-like isoform X2 [Gigantopelta aegis]|uniref:tripartite motif-containing protein 43C-like isoform X2 n=1 Tax=Gigantopelta aegis TaxID=1735272 RepID=UPI001B88D244|nr:tripartite motif-containing protein 43C-like isoform X2 [Gigantopelta aegis]
MSTMECSICVDSLYRPTTCIPCGHVFCESCITQWEQMTPNKLCPNCRVRINLTQRLIWDGKRSVKRKAFKFLNVEKLRQLTVQAKASWNSFGIGGHFFFVFLLTFMLCAVVHDAKNERGFILGCLLPVVAPVADIVRHLMSFFLNVFNRLSLCVRRCHPEVMSMLWDVALDLKSLGFDIVNELAFIPGIFLTSVGTGMLLLLNITAEVTSTITRLALVFTLAFVVLLLAKPYSRGYVDMLFTKLLRFWRKLRRLIEEGD